MHYKPMIAFMTSPPEESKDEFAERVNARIAELSDRHVIEDVQYQTFGTNWSVMIRYRLDKWAPTMREDT